MSSTGHLVPVWYLMEGIRSDMWHLPVWYCMESPWDEGVARVVKRSPLPDGFTQKEIVVPFLQLLGWEKQNVSHGPLISAHPLENLLPKYSDMPEPT